VVEFPPYSPAELVQIFAHQAVKGHYEVQDGVLELVRAHFEGQSRLGNARDARKIFEAMIERQAERLAEVAEPTRDQLLWLLPEDFPGDGDHN
jgi:hypothetical protein